MPREETSIQGVGQGKVEDPWVYQRVEFVANGPPPPKRFACPRFTFRALDPQKINRIPRF